MPAQLTPDWFDRFWADNSERLPFVMRGESFKNLAWSMFSLLLDAMGAQAKTPDGVRVIIAFQKVIQILRGTQGVLDSPNPSPEQVAEAVERLAQRVKA